MDGSIFSAIIDFFVLLSDWIGNGIYDFVKEGFAWIFAKGIILYIKFKIMVISYSYGIAKTVVEGLNISDYLTEALSNFPSTILNSIMFFRIPEAINIIMNAFIARFVLRFIPFA